MFQGENFPPFLVLPASIIASNKSPSPVRAFLEKPHGNILTARDVPGLKDGSALCAPRVSPHDLCLNTEGNLRFPHAHMHRFVQLQNKVSKINP